MTQDARDSLTALVSVLAFIAFGYVAMKYLPDFAIPDWLFWLVFGLNGLGLFHGLRIRRHRAPEDSSAQGKTK